MTDPMDDAIRATVAAAHQADPDQVEFDVTAGLTEVL
jgi:hypothetical protein